MAKKIKLEEKAIVKEKHAGGRPTLYNESQLKFIKYMAARGATDQEIADVLDIAVNTVGNWKKSIPEFAEKLKTWKDEADEEIEKSLYARAKGYSHKETKLFCHEGMIIAEDIVKHYPPDPTSIIFWLKNRKQKEWRDRQEHSFENVDDAELLKEVAELVKGKDLNELN